EMVTAEAEQTAPQPGQAVEEQGPQEPETPQKTSVPDAVPQSPTNSEPIAEIKVTRRASQATDKAQKRARRLSVPGNLFSFFTGVSRRKSGFWGESPLVQGSKDSEVSSAAVGTVGTCTSDGKESESTDKLKKQTSDVVDAPSNKTAETKDKETKAETDKEEAQNSNHANTPAQTELPTDSSETETLDQTKEDTDAEENVKFDDSENNDQTFWKSLKKPAIVDKDTAHPQSTPVIALCLETPLAKKTERNEGNCKYDYLDLACPLKTCNSVDIDKNLTVEMPSNNVPEEVPDLKAAQQTPEPSENDAVEERTEDNVEDQGELETDGGMEDTTKEESNEIGKDVDVGTEEHITSNEDHITMKVECEDVNEAVKEEHVTTEVGHEDVNSSNEKSEEEETCEKVQDLCPETEEDEHSTNKENVTMEVDHEDVNSRNENSENMTKSDLDEEMEIPTQDETTTDTQMPEISCQNKEDTSSDGEKIIVSIEEDAADDQDKTSPTEICSEKKEDGTDSKEPEQEVHINTNDIPVINVAEEQSKHLGEDTTDAPGLKLKKQVMFAVQEDKNEQEMPLANGLKNSDLTPPHESNGSTPKESNEDIIPPLSPTEPPLVTTSKVVSEGDKMEQQMRYNRNYMQQREHAQLEQKLQQQREQMFRHIEQEMTVSHKPFGLS
ncbi:hypothetical protein M9458_021746, partial [Cirrhinus mrigala]